MNQEERMAQRFAEALDGKLEIPEELSPEEQQALEALLGTAMFLRCASQPPLDLAALTAEVQQVAGRKQRSLRLAWLSVAAAACVVFGLFQLGTQRPEVDVLYPEVPVLREAFSPETSPLTRLEPVYEAGLRGAREARYLGAYHAAR